MIVKETGVLHFKGELKTGQSASGKHWGRQQIVMSTPGFQGATRFLLLNARTNSINELSRINIGDQIEVAYEANAREWNGKWYTDVDLISITGHTAQGAPAAPAPAPAMAPQGFAPETGEQGEDLPF